MGKYRQLLPAIVGTSLLGLVLAHHKGGVLAAEEAEAKIVVPAASAGSAPAAAVPIAGRPSGPRPVPSSAVPPGAGPGSEGKSPEGPAKGDSPDKKPEGGDKKPGEEKKPDTPSTPSIQRPSAPPKPGDPEELKLKPDAEGKIRFNFTNQKWGDVLQWLADISKMSLDWQELPGDYLNLVTVDSYTLDEARDLINRHLLDRGYTLLRRGEVMSVAKLDKLNTALVPWVQPEQLEGRDAHEFVKVTFPLESLLAESAAEELKPMVSQHGKLNPLKNTNRLEAVDAVVNLREIQRLLAEEQSNTGEGSLVAKFELKHTRAAEVRELLMQLLGVEEKKPAGPQPGQPGQPQPQPQPEQRPGQPGAQPPKKEPEVRIVADERLNTVYVSAPPDKLAIVRQAVEAIDVPKAEEQSPAHGVTRMKAYRLESLDPEALLKTLKGLGGLGVDTRFEVDKNSKAIIAYASLADHVIIASVINKLDGGARHAEVIQLTDLRADSVARTVDYMMGGGPEESEKAEERSDESESYSPFFFPGRSSSRSGGPEKKHEDRFRVDADVKNNRLLLWCNEFELAKVEQLLENLGGTSHTGLGAQTLQVHRLVSLEPDPFIKTLKEMEALSVGATLEADRQNRAIIANASEADHAKIRELITRLDGSGREFQVINLRRLEADSVAGTIAFMMTGKQDDQKSGYSRTYYFYDYYRPSRDKQQKKEDEFRVEADIEYNRLLLWANTVEMEEVHKLLVKLGEVPPDEGNRDTIRLLDIPPGPERDQLLERLRRAWPSILPNPLTFPQQQSTPDEKEKTDEGGKKAEPKTKEGASPSGSTTQAEVPARGEPAGRIDSAWFRLAQLQQPPQAEPAARAEPAHPAQNQPPASGEAAPPSAAVAPGTGDAGNRPAPIIITESPDGRLIISSQDTEALDRLEMMMGQTASPRRDYEIIHLKYGEAYWVALTLEDFFGEKQKKGGSDDYMAGWYGWPPSNSSSGDETRRLSRRKPLKFISDDTTNTILVQGATPEQMRTIKELVEIYDRPAMTDSESARKTDIFQIRYAKAAVVAEAIKDVYRDLLSENDKALINSKKEQKEPKADRIYTLIETGDEDKDLERKPRFKGYLSLGVDEVSNTLVVSAPEFLFRDISRLIKQLDDAARPTIDDVRVIKLGNGVHRAQLEEKLAKILGAPPVAKATKSPETVQPPGAENNAAKNGQPAKD